MIENAIKNIVISVRHFQSHWLVAENASQNI